MMCSIKATGLTRKTSFPRRRESRIPHDFNRLLGQAFFLFLLPIFSSFPFLTPSQAADIKTDLTLSAGYRVDDFRWNIAGSSNNPNILSELTWSNLETIQATAKGTAVVNTWLYLRGSLGYGYTFSGHNQDSDYSGNDRTQEYSRSSNRAEDGRALDAAMGIGYRFSFLSGRFTVSPLLGYSYSEQKLTQKDGVQVIASGSTPSLGPIQGLDSSYETSWMGPWLGIDLSFEITERIILSGSFEYHWASYDAEGDLNLRNDLAHPKSYEHDADGKGLLITLGAEVLLSGPWALNLAFTYQKWSTDPGVDRLYYASGSVQETRLNEVNWDSWALMLGIVYSFGHP
jgi:hypothetical protein